MNYNQKIAETSGPVAIKTKSNYQYTILLYSPPQSPENKDKVILSYRYKNG